MSNIDKPPPGLAPDKLRQCAQCGQDEWVHHTYWAATVGAAHAFLAPEEAA